MPLGRQSAIVEAGVSGAIRKEKTPASRTRRAMSWAVWPPKSRMTTIWSWGKRRDGGGPEPGGMGNSTPPGGGVWLYHVGVVGCRDIALSLILVAAGVPAGCAQSASFQDPDPGSRLNAIEHAVGANDRSCISDLITLLDSDDAAVRLFAIEALERFTGRTLGYDHAAPEHERRLAVERWVRWRREQTGESSFKGVKGSGGADLGPI